MVDLLENFSDSLERTEAILILWVVLLSVSVSFAIIAAAMYWVHPWNRIWFHILWVSCTATVVSLVLLIEPRPSHWLPSMEKISSGVAKCSPAEWKLRMRRWWRWRTKYAARTKLNV